MKCLFPWSWTQHFPGWNLLKASILTWIIALIVALVWLITRHVELLWLVPFAWLLELLLLAGCGVLCTWTKLHGCVTILLVSLGQGGTIIVELSLLTAGSRTLHIGVWWFGDGKLICDGSSGAWTIFVFWLMLNFPILIIIVPLLKIFISEVRKLIILRHVVILLWRLLSILGAHSLASAPSLTILEWLLIIHDRLLILLLIVVAVHLLSGLICRGILLPSCSWNNWWVTLKIHFSIWSLRIFAIAKVTVSVRVKILVIVIAHFAVSVLGSSLIKVGLILCLFCLTVVATAHLGSIFVTHWFLYLIIFICS